MSLLEDMATLIPSDVSETSPVFFGDYPSEPDNIVTLYPSGGEDPSHSFTDKEFENPSLQVRVRDKSYAVGYLHCEAIKDAMDGLTERVINGNRYISIFQQGDVLPLGRDSEGRAEFSLNFNIRVKRGG